MSRPVLLVLVCLSLFLVLFPLAVGKPGLPTHLKADEAAYYLMSLSLARDHDLRCETKDLHRLYDEFPVDVRNLILSSPDGWKTVYFAKPYVYSLLAMPFAALFGANGMVAFNMALLLLAVALATVYLSRFNPGWLAALYAGGFFFLSHAFAYVFWIQPEVFNLTAITLALYLGFHVPSESLPATGLGRFLRRVTAGSLRPAWSGAALALAVYNKPPYLLLAVPLVGAQILRRRFRAAGTWAAGMALMGLILAGLAVMWTGHPTAYLGMARRGVMVTTPLSMPIAEVAAPPGVTPPNTAGWDWIMQLAPYGTFSALTEDIQYFLWGRHVGILLYAPFLLFSLVLFLRHARGSLERWLLLASALGVGVYFMLFITFNWHGGGGFVGNRYFVSVIPAFIFLVTRIDPPWLTALAYAAGGLLMGPLVFTPFGAPVPFPTLQAHTRSLPFRWFPLEMSLRGNIPGYRGTSAGGASFVGREDLFRRVRDEMWCVGATTVEFAMLAPGKLDTAVFRVRDLARGNRVELRLGNARHVLDFGDVPPEGETRDVEFQPGPGYKLRTDYEAQRTLYTLTVKTSTGEKPAWRSSGRDNFYLGAVVTYLGTRADLDKDIYAVKWGAMEVPATAVAGRPFTVLTRLSNASREVWPGAGAAHVNLSYHWFDAADKPIGSAALRTPIGHEVRPAGVVAIAQTVVAPEQPGRYTLAVEPILENVRWFSERRPDIAYRTVVEVTAVPPGAAPVADGGAPGAGHRARRDTDEAETPGPRDDESGGD